MVTAGWCAVILAATAAGAAQVNVDWTAGPQTATHPTYQTSINPLYRRDALPGTSNISATVFEKMKELRADYMRHVPWFPYPRLAVAELAPPMRHPNGTCTTSWDFTYIDPITEALFEALDGHPMVMNFATTPEWMWVGGENITAPPVNVRDAGYEAGPTPRDTSYEEFAGYWVRLAQYYTQGGMVDECGKFHKGYKYDVAWWEVLNEPEFEHMFQPAEYNALYDAVVPKLRAVMPNVKFLGLALGGHNEWGFYETFLNRSLHASPDVPIHGVSFHDYVIGDDAAIEPLAQMYFAGVDAFVAEVGAVAAIRQRHAASTPVELFINEIGCGSQSYRLPGFYNLCSATYAYLFAKVAPLQVEHVGMSQVVGFEGKAVCPTCPDEWPSTSMVNWFSGAGNARYHTLKMMIANIPLGSKVAHPTTVTAAAGEGVVAAQALSLSGGTRKVVVVNTGASPVNVVIGGNVSYTAEFVDDTTGDAFGCDGAACIGAISAPTTAPLRLGMFGVAVVTVM